MASQGRTRAGIAVEAWVNFPFLEMGCEIAIETPEKVWEERTEFTSLDVRWKDGVEC
ncbi:hypothetical protein PAXRUDRAFT_821287 [Paxillus rubicundulus Ve08.2h10]|uniref:Unplaced genomic scaffold scaffold_4, whole genome shotgun sequence n=1 Tax=Paxillus rubicundulus Ve08.2h10 TaxID=930991 RepID=A0A0D0E6S9_9AGAM|nr:hypothetical protein PAXRUDRAFT_821287 [Paxillus rubicundulus Ve08.2h10]